MNPLVFLGCGMDTLFWVGAVELRIVVFVVCFYCFGVHLHNVVVCSGQIIYDEHDEFTKI